MKNIKEKIRSFTDLNAWKESHRLVLQIYKSTESFPNRERYGLVDQIRRAAVSISSNIAEGFSRNSIREKIQFYYMSLGSLSELQNLLLIARDVKYLSQQEFYPMALQSIEVNKLIHSLIKHLEGR